MSEKVSVIIPSFNHARFIRQAISSALEQSYGNLEVVVVDDGSADDSYEAALSIEDSRVRVYRNEQNLGAYATQNRAMDLAEGQWIAVLNSDDMWQPFKLERQLDAIRAHGEHWSFALGSYLDEHGATLEGDPHGDWPTDEVQNLLPRLLEANRILASTLLFRRGTVRFHEELRYTGDWVALLGLAERGPGICVRERLVGWRQHGDNSYRRSPALTLEEIRVRRAILGRADHWLAHSSDPDAVRKGLGACALALSALYVLVGQMRLARATAKLAAGYRPGDAPVRRRRLVTAMPKGIARRKLWPTDAPVRLDPAALEGPGLVLDAKE